MHYLWIILIAAQAFLHCPHIHCDDIGISSSNPVPGINGGIPNINHLNLNTNNNNNNLLAGNGMSIPKNIGSSGLPTSVNSTLLNTLRQSVGVGSVSHGIGMNPVSTSGGMSSLGLGIGSGSSGGTMSTHGTHIVREQQQQQQHGGGGSHMTQHGGGGGSSQGHALAGLASLGIIINGGNGNGGLTGLAGPGGGGMRNGMGGMRNNLGMGVGNMDRNMDRDRDSDGAGGQGQYYENFISEHTVMAVFTSQGVVGGPCRYMPATRRQNHQCRKEVGLPETLREARRLATGHCENQFRYDRWNCSIETRGKRHIFKKLYKETAFVHALTAAAMTHSIARACAEGRMTKCSCGPSKQNRVDAEFQWGGCNDNLKHGKRVTRSFLELRGGDGDNDEVSEILRHDSEVGIEAVSSLMKDKCKCHGVSGSCSMKTCWKKMSDFDATATLLRQKYNQAIRKAPNQRTMRQVQQSGVRMQQRKSKQRRKKSQYTTLYYLETSPTYCSVTKDRQCTHPDNCANLCCGRGYTTRVYKQVEKCRCRFNNGRCCQLICDYCQKFEDRYFCK